MPCGEKWKNKTMKRIPLPRGIGHGGDACCGSCAHGGDCESACPDHGVRPTPWWKRAGHCCESCAYGLPRATACPCNRGIAGKKKRARRQAVSRLPALRKAPRGMGASNACGGGCDSALGSNPNATGCATGIWPDPRGEFFGFQHGRGRRVPVRLYNQMMPRQALPGDCYGPESCW